MGCILLHHSELNWTASNQFCEDQESHLIEIRTMQQMQFIVSILSEKKNDPDPVAGWWTGATDVDNEGTWSWTVNKNQTVGQYIWANSGGEPNGGSRENYLALWRGYHYKGMDAGDWGLDMHPLCQKL